MRTRHLLAAVVTCVTASTGFAQTTGGTGTGGGSSTGGGNSGLNTGSASAFEIQQMQAAPPITATTSTSTLSSTNALSQYYGNPYYQGRAGSTGQDTPGGFGSALTGTGGGGGTGRAVGATGLNAGRTGTAGTGTTGRTTGGNTGTTGLGGTTGAGGRTGGATGATGFGGAAGFGGGTTGFGGTTGLGGRTTGQGGRAGQLGGTTQQQGQGNAIIPLPRAVSYTMTVRMPVPQVSAPQMQADLRSVLDRSSMIANPRGIAVSMDGSTVVLRGTVKDEDEAKTAEGMIRLTPGVKTVKNELKY